MIRKYYADLSQVKQCKLLKICRSSLYYTPVGVNAETLKLMNENNRVFTKYPFFRCPTGRCAAMAREGAATRSLHICRE
jgi:putative transposase